MSAACEPFRDAISARADGESSPVGDDALATHLDGCARCTTFAAGVVDLDRRVRVAPAEQVPDLTAAILTAVDTPDLVRERSRFDQLRGLLAMAGVVQLVLAVPLLLGGVALAPHASREAVVFELALGVGFLVVAWRPVRAGGLLPVAAVVSLLLVVLAAVDLAAGATGLVAESPHLVELVGTGLLWALDRRVGRATLHPTTA